MKSFKRALLISLIIHVFLLGLFSLQFPERKKPSLVKVRLVSVSRASLRSSSSSASTSRPVTKKAAKTRNRPKKQTSTPRKKSKLRKKRSKSRHPKTSKSNKRPKTKEASPLPRPELTPQEEDSLEEKLDDLQIRQRLRELERKVASREENAGKAPAKGPSFEDYEKLVKAHLDSFFEVPLTLKARRNLSTIVKIHLAPDGKLLSCDILKSSGNSLFDRTVEAAIKAAEPYPPPGKPLTIKATFTQEGLSF